MKNRTATLDRVVMHEQNESSKTHAFSVDRREDRIRAQARVMVSVGGRS